MTTRRIFAAALTAGILLTACGGAQPDPTAAGDWRPSDDVVLEVRDEGGFVPLEWNLGRVPRYVLTAGGVLYGPGAVPAIFPGPMLPAIQAVTIDDQAMADILQYVEDLGLDSMVSEHNDEATQTVADATDTVVTYFDNAGGSHEFSVYALGIGPHFTDARVAVLGSMIERLDRAFSTGVPTDVSTPERVQVYALAADATSGDPTVTVLPWPLPMPASEMPTNPDTGWGCVTLEGADVTSVWETFSAANQSTRWDDGGTIYTLVAKPLFSHQPGC